MGGSGGAGILLWMELPAQGDSYGWIWRRMGKEEDEAARGGWRVACDQEQSGKRSASMTPVDM
jgi:hypothetical protein